jgi:hypothetical protein
MQLDKARTGSPVQLLRHPEYRNFITARVFLYYGHAHGYYGCGLADL